MTIMVSTTTSYMEIPFELIKTEGNFYFEWDQQDGLFTPAAVGQDASDPPRQSTSAAFPKSDDACGNRAPFTGPGHHASHADAQPALLGFGQEYTDHQVDISTRPSPNGFQYLANRQLAEEYPGAGIASDKTSQAAWGQQVQRRAPRKPAGRKTGRATKSDRCEDTASSRNDTSVSRVHVADISQIHHNDPMLGDAQRKYDNVVRNSLLQDSYQNNDCLLRPGFKRLGQSEAETFFRVGRVFAMLWHENAGPKKTVDSGRAPSYRITAGKFQELIYSTIRRMIVVKEQNGCCWCVPILTYNRKGVAKKSIDRSKHAVVY
ncbi:hypothetical protein N7475_005572 [Penicillium sp. IBT 31633x]|nr:hypothetical protein N7475_005572 [Penicillium sp. IBT 31633x]